MVTAEDVRKALPGRLSITRILLEFGLDSPSPGVVAEILGCNKRSVSTQAKSIGLNWDRIGRRWIHHKRQSVEIRCRRCSKPGHTMRYCTVSDGGEN